MKEDGSRWRNGSTLTTAHDMLYFDHNATAPICAAARDAWLDATERFIGNPSSPHRLGARADAALEDAREKLAGSLGCKAAEIVWTSGATEANNMIAAHFANTGSGGEAWVSAIEHPCVIAAARRYFGGRTTLIPVTGEGVVDLNWLADSLKRTRPRFVAIMAANNETGVLQPWAEASQLCGERGVPFVCDAAQWIGKMPARELGHCDYVSGCAHKFGGPQGVGFLKCPTRTTPLLHGGPQEDGRRAGTENLAGVLAMVAALEERNARIASGEIDSHMATRQLFESHLTSALSDCAIVAARSDRLWNTVSLVMLEIDCRQRWVVKLDRLGFAVSTGSACSSGKEAPSHVLSAMGLPAELAGGVLRFSSGWETRPSSWDELLGGLQRACAEARR